VGWINRTALSRALRIAVAATVCAGPCLMSAQTTAAVPPADQPSVGCRLSPRFVEANRARIEKLFSALDLDRPDLADCALAYKRGDLRNASEVLLRHYAAKRRTLPVEPLRAADAETLRRATDALHGIFTEQNVRAKQSVRSGGGLDWSSRGENGDKEWVWFLNRHLFLRDLAEAYLATGRMEYADALSDYLSDWVVANPYPDRLTFSAQWRALESARRITDSWAVIFQSPRIPLKPEARMLLLCSLPDHARELSAHGTFWGGNHRLTELTALAIIAEGWPEFRDSRHWLDMVFDEARAEILSETYPDGAYKELSNHYQHVVLDSLEKLLAVLRMSGRDDPLLAARAAAMWDYYACLMKPYGDGPLNNEGDLEYNRRDVEAVWQHYNRADWRFIASNGRDGTQPTQPPSRYYEWAGQAVMRGGWDDRAQWAFFDMGPHGTAHQHNDRLSFELVIGGDPILADSGRYTYQPGPWKEYFSSAQAHNMVLIDGAGPVPPPLEVSKPMPVSAFIADTYDFFAATNAYDVDVLSGRGGARHTRSFFYRRGGYWIIVDHVEIVGLSKVDVLWHFAPSAVASLCGGEVVASIGGSPVLDLRQIGGPDASWSFIRGSEHPIQGWVSTDYNTKQPATVGVAECTVERPATFVWLLRPASMPERVAKVVETAGRLEITVGADRLVLDPANGTPPQIEVNGNAAK
jgi:hypothetical protein